MILYRKVFMPTTVTTNLCDTWWEGLPESHRRTYGKEFYFAASLPDKEQFTDHEDIIIEFVWGRI